MVVLENKRRVDEFGDFQTPVCLTEKLCKLLASYKLRPVSIVEPTCGVGNFLISAVNHFPTAKKVIGSDVNSIYIDELISNLRQSAFGNKVEVIRKSFFDVNWTSLLKKLPEPVLVVGNPPWITNSDLCTIRSSNLPNKSNIKDFNGMDAMTGKSNFDISEWMLMQILEWIDGRNATMAMLCKTTVARKLLVHAWKNNISLKWSYIYMIDAKKYFGVSVDACFLVCHSTPLANSKDCQVYCHIENQNKMCCIGYRDGKLIAEAKLYEKWKHLQGEEIYKWRSGIKHDCVKIMQFQKEGIHYRNGLNEVVELEDDYVFPMLKSSDLVNKYNKSPKRWMLVTQKYIGEETEIIRERARKTWEYLEWHAALLGNRASSVYKGNPRFSVFGVGDYSFAPWKVAISGFYKQLEFKVVGEHLGKPIILDDTIYFISCVSKEEAQYLSELLNSTAAQEFFRAFIFWDMKRPITLEILRRLDLTTLAGQFSTGETLKKYLLENRKYHNNWTSETPLLGSLFQ